METFKKRQKETRRLERQRDKAARRMQRKQAQAGGATETAPDGEPIATDGEPIATDGEPIATSESSPNVEPTTDA
jgi:hypothetical protein